MGVSVAKERDALSWVIMVAAFFASCVLRINVIYIILVCMVLGAGRTLFCRRRREP